MAYDNIKVSIHSVFFYRFAKLYSIIFDISEKTKKYQKSIDKVPYW